MTDDNECAHEAWESNGGWRTCADCRTHLGPDATLPLDESEQCTKCGNYACDCYASPEPPSDPSDAQVEVACREFYEDARGITSWQLLTSSDPSLADDYRRGMRRALRAASEYA